MDDLSKKLGPGCAGLLSLLLVAVIVIGSLLGIDMGPLKDVLRGDSVTRSPRDTKTPTTTKTPTNTKTPTRDDPPARGGERPKTPFDSTPDGKRGNVKNNSFSRARHLLGDMHRDHPKTFYCGCSFNDGKVNLSSCGYKVRKNATRASRVEYEHVMPASLFGQRFSAWTKGHPSCTRSSGKPYKGRACLEKVSRKYRFMQADMHNLQPAIGEVNGDRSNYPVGEISGERREYGACDVEIDGQIIEPREAIRGKVARAHLYMDWAYPALGLLTAKERAMFTAWSRKDPPDGWEIERARRIAKQQGNPNPFVEQYAKTR